MKKIILLFTTIVLSLALVAPALASNGLGYNTGKNRVRSWGNGQLAHMYLYQGRDVAYFRLTSCARMSSYRVGCTVSFYNKNATKQCAARVHAYNSKADRFYVRIKRISSSC